VQRAKRIMAYEVFMRSVVRVKQPTLSLVPDGRITLNAAATRALAEANVRFVLLLWDKASDKIAIKAAPKGDKNAYTVSFSHNRQASSLRAKLFMSHIGWSLPKRQMLPATWDKDNKLLEAVLPQGHFGLRKQRRLEAEG
jgi:hypothetical protein